MNTPLIRVKLGKDLSQEMINLMITNRIREYGENTKDFEKNEQDSIFFFVLDKKVIKAFGMLKPVKIRYNDIEYSIMGIGNIMALEKGKGYGSFLMNHIRTYLIKNKYVGVGNTYNTNFEFYKKCGFTLVPGLVDRFVEVDIKGVVLKRWKDYDEWENYGMFIYDERNALKATIYSSGDVFISVPLW